MHITSAHALGLASVIVTAVAAANDSFTIIALPDTQNYVNSSGNAPLFTQQTRWITDEINLNGNPRNIRFVTHLGDVVSTGTSITQWNRADASMSELETGPDGVVPYGILPGNHDYASTGNKSTGTDNYIDYFGPSRFAGRTWYGGADPSGNNSYQFFTAAGITFLHLALEWQPTVNVTNGPVRDPSPVEWAQSIISANAGMPTIVSTHEYIDDSPAGRSGAGEALWNELIRRNDQIIMVLNGHFHSVGGTNDGEYHQVSSNDFGKDVVEVLQDYQDYPNGGDGWLRIITFDIRDDEIRFETYSPVLDQFQTETVADVGQFASQFTIMMDFDERFMFEDPPQPPAPIFETRCFQQGVDGYAGTQDKEIRSSGGDAGNGDNTEISVDGDDGSPGLQPNQALVRFDDVIGAGQGQVQSGTTIESATLSLNIINPGSGMSVYAMTTDWDETTTWTDLGGDGVTPGIEADASPQTVVGADDGGTNIPTGTLTLDITDAVQGWLNGNDAYGVALIPFPSGTNGIDFTTSESTNPPVLKIRSLLPGLSLVAFRQGENGYTMSFDTQLREADPNTDYANASTVSVDNDDPAGNENHILIRFDQLFGVGGVPTDEEIVRATLSVTGVNPGDGATLHRMLQSWNDTDTWAGAFGGNGVQADDVEAVSAPDAVTAGGTGLVEIDVTASVIAWAADPSSNDGWVMLPLGTNGWDFVTSEGAAAERPRLVVVTRPFPCPADCAPDNGDGTFGNGIVNVDDLLEAINAFGGGAGPCDNAPDNGDGTFGNGVINIDDLLGVINALGPCP